MPDILARGDELRQHESPWADKAPELEDAAARRPEEQIVIEEAGIDRVAEEELIALWRRAVHKDDRDAFLVEHAGPGVGVVHLDLGGAGYGPIDDELVSGRIRPTEEGID